MIYLETEVLLHHLLLRREFHNNVITFANLRQMRNAIDKTMESNGVKELIYPQITQNDLGRAVEQYPQYFAWKDNGVGRAKNSQDLYSENPQLSKFSFFNVSKNIEKLVLDTIGTFKIGQ